MTLLTTLRLSEDATPDLIGREFLRVWPQSKVVHISGVAPSIDLRDFYSELFKRIGEPLPYAEDATLGDRESQRTGDIWMEVRYDPAIPDAYRHSSNPQPLHTDLSYIPVRGATGFLGCVAMPPEGGATTFIDAVDLVGALRAEAPDMLARLEDMVMPHARSGDRRVEKVIRYENGQPLLNWNYYCVSSEVSSDGQALREAFFEFLKGSPGVASGLKRVKLAPGEAVLWKDEQVLHGRDGFDAERPSERFLWKSGLKIAA